MAEQTGTPGQSSGPQPHGGPSHKNNAARRKYYQDHKAEILSDFENGMAEAELRHKWGIPSSTWSYLKKRWKAGPQSGKKPSPPAQPDPPGGSIVEVYFAGGGYVKLFVSVDLLAVTKKDRDLVFDLVDKLRAYTVTKGEGQGKETHGTDN